MTSATARLTQRRVDPGKRLYSPTLALAIKTIDDSDPDIGIIEGIASTPGVDRMGDIVEPLGAVFTLPLPLLWQHDSRAPIGKVVSAKVTAKGIEVVCHVYKSLAQSIGTQWQLIKAGLVPAFSIGFRELESVPIDPKNPFAGQRFTSWEWLELSSVTIPANADALVENAKSFCTDPDDPDSDGTSRAKASAPVAPGAPTPPRIPARSPTPVIGVRAVKTAERIEQLQREINAHTDTINEVLHACETETRDPSDDEALAVKTATEEIERKSNSLEAYTSAQQVEARKADAARGGPKAPAIIGQRTKSRTPGDFLIKTALVALHSHVKSRDPDQIVDELFARDAEAVQVIKSIINPAMTTVAGWAAELVREDTQGYLDLLQPVSLWRQLAALGLDLNFNGAGSIKVPGRLPTPTIPGSFVGEGKLIPVKRIGFTSTTLSPYKMAVISTFTREIVEQSTPNIETILRQAITDDTSKAIDAALLSLDPAVVGVRPAGVQVGMTTSASAGNTLANIIADARLMTTSVVTKGARKPVWIMNPARVQGLALITNATGQFMFADDIAQGRWLGYPLLVSNNVPPTVVYLLDAADFISAFDQPNFEVSNQATIIEVDEDDDPYIATGGAPDSAITDIGTAATATPPGPIRSLFQTDTLALRMIMPLSWHLFRAVNSYALTGVNW